MRLCAVPGVARAACLLVLVPVFFYGFASGPPPRKTGAPGDRNCLDCHFRGDGGNVVVNFPHGSFYAPGVAQVFQIVITEPDRATDGYGFQMTARLESDLVNGQAGDFTPGFSERVICDDGLPEGAGGCPGIEFIEHSGPFVINKINVMWTPPAADAGNVHIYVAANAGNSMGGHVYLAHYTLAPVPAGPPPSVSSVVNGGSFLPGIESGSWTTIFGTDMAPPGDSRIWNSATEIVNGVLPTSLDGVSVTIDGKAAAVYYISPTQLNVQPPDDASLGPVDVVVSTLNGASSKFTAQLQKYSPGFFMYTPQNGRYIAAQIALPDGSVEILAPAGLFGSGVTSRPVKSGEIIILYGTGFGPTNPAVPAGLVFNGAAQTADTVTVTVGGVGAEVQFAGISGAGLYQLNIVVPALPDGDQKVFAMVGGLSSQDNAFITVQN